MKNNEKKIDYIKKYGNNYNTENLIDDLKNEINLLTLSKEVREEKLTYNNLSSYLGREKNYIKNILKRQLRRNPEHIISEEILDGYERSLISRFEEKSKNLIKFIEKYRISNQPLKSTKYQIYKHHPNFIIDSFEKIDTKEKAYWLGLLCADFFREKMKRGKIRLGLELIKKDEILIDRFANVIGFNLNYKAFRIKKLEYKGEIREYEMVIIRFINTKMTNDLEKYCINGSKSKRTSLPELGKIEFNLAFLLGFYDGDGIQGTTKVISGSKKILEQIKEKYNLPYKISKHKHSNTWIMSLGAKLFNDMMINYKLSLERKRKKFELRRYKVNENFEKKITKEKLQELVWAMSIVKIAKNYKVHHRNITDLCKKWGVNIPPTGYWNRKKFIDNKNKNK